MKLPLDEFRDRVMANTDLQSALIAEREMNKFCDRVLHHAACFGIGVARPDIDIPPDPAGILSLLPTPANGLTWPPADWLPVGLMENTNGQIVTWHCFDGIPTDTPFFYDAAAAARARPFNRTLNYRMPLTAMMETAPHLPQPAGLIFHLSRCGSTLVHRMLSASNAVTSLSEVPIFDEAVQFCLNWHGPLEVKHKVLRTIIAGLSNAANRWPLVLKLDSWHTLSWPLILGAFPDTPAIFLYREPAEILVSQQRMRGIQAIPSPLIAALCGIADCGTLSLDEYCAHYLAVSCRAAADAARAKAVRVINYKRLPRAVFDEILPHFGLQTDAAADDRMRNVAGFHSKSPNECYVPDSEEKNRAASGGLRTLAEQIVGPSYRMLESLAGRSSPAAGELRQEFDPAD